MKVAIDSGPLTGGDSIRGIGFHTKELVTHLRKINDLEVKTVDFKSTDLKEFDIIHYPYFHPHFLTLPFVKPKAKVVLTIHDLIRLICPKAYPPGLRGEVKYFLQKTNLRNVDAVITISETSKKDIVRFLNINPQKIFVIYLAAQCNPEVVTSTKKVSKKYNLPREFILYVGDINYNKNIINLAKASKLVKLPLVIVGKQAALGDFDKNHAENRHWSEFLELFGEDRNIMRVGYVASEDLSAFYKLASVYCQPSLYEGFGLPVLESFKNKCPVVCSRTQALVEVARDSAIYADPKSIESFSKAIVSLIRDKHIRENYIKQGLKRVSEFSWKKSAEETYQVYKSCLSQQ